MPLTRLWSSPGPGQSQAVIHAHCFACREERVWHCAMPLRHGGIMNAMSSPGCRRFPVAVTRIPVTPCQIRRRTAACRPGSLSEVLTEHYRRAHPAALGFPSR